MDALIADFKADMWLYISIPFISGLIGYVTKVVAIKMMFQPIEFWGIKPFLGWQGIVPRKAEKMATIAVDLMTERLIKPEEIFARLDPARIAREIEVPMMEASEDIVREVMQEYQPGLWEGMPEFMRQRIIKRVKGEAPKIVASIMGEVQVNVSRYFDIRHMVISNLKKDKKLLNEIFQRVGKQELKFFCKAGFYFGFIIGLVQMVCWLVWREPWMLPAFGGFVGLFSDWLALQMLFRPLNPKKLFGYTLHGLFLKRQQEVAGDYAALISKQMLTPGIMMEELFSGPRSDRVIQLLQKQVRRVVDEQAGVARPLVLYAVGTSRYIEMKQHIADRILERLPETMKHMEEYAEDAMDVRNTLITRMRMLTPTEFEGMLRPAFKEEEWILITVGAVLGFMVGEMQIQFML
ncbi:DUF445 domain-containing protein [Perlucidibaca piscinae]|uniref:DUF445 domain-containing protein n=1 Tax=Perlucidibaca piscinae TaxID=392589 RepID=UPI0003B3B256|nr:DUF445 family protein [Perlucidibaca piscinae]